MLDYHDLLMPYVNEVREIEGTTLYGSRTLFFLTDNGTLRPLAIELTRPPVGDKPQWKQVFTPTWDSTGCWLWRLAKAHVCAHDSGYHQLVIHWYYLPMKYSCLPTQTHTRSYLLYSVTFQSTCRRLLNCLFPNYAG